MDLLKKQAIIGRALADTGLSKADVSAFFILVEGYQEGRGVWWGAKAIALRMSIHPDTAKKSLRKLSKLGYIRALGNNLGGRGHTNNYEILSAPATLKKTNGGYPSPVKGGGGHSQPPLPDSKLESGVECAPVDNSYPLIEWVEEQKTKGNFLHPKGGQNPLKTGVVTPYKTVKEKNNNNSRGDRGIVKGERGVTHNVDKTEASALITHSDAVGKRTSPPSRSLNTSHDSRFQNSREGLAMDWKELYQSAIKEKLLRHKVQNTTAYICFSLLEDSGLSQKQVATLVGKIPKYINHAKPLEHWIKKAIEQENENGKNNLGACAMPDLQYHHGNP